MRRQTLASTEANLRIPEEDDTACPRLHAYKIVSKVQAVHGEQHTDGGPPYPPFSPNGQTVNESQGPKNGANANTIVPR